MHVLPALTYIETAPSDDSMCILLTGGTGFLGSYILERLLAANFEVIVLKRSFSKTWRIDHLLDRVKTYDTDVVSLRRVFEENKIDVVLHAATVYGRKNEAISDVVEANLLFPLRLLDMSISFNVDTFLNVDTVLPGNLNYYVLSKKQFLQYAKPIPKGKMRFINVKLEHVYGPKDDSSKFIIDLVDKMLMDVSPINLTEGKQERDFIYVEDAADAFIPIISSRKKLQKKFHDFGVGTGKALSIRDLCMLVKKLCNSKSELRFGAIPYRKNEPMLSKSDNKYVLGLGWKPSTDIEEGLATTIEWEKKQIAEKQSKS